MNNNTFDSTRIRRRNFFFYLGALVAGIFSITKLPGRIFKSKINSEISTSSKIKVIVHPQAVRRETGDVKNG